MMVISSHLKMNGLLEHSLMTVDMHNRNEISLETLSEILVLKKQVISDR